MNAAVVRDDVVGALPMESHRSDGQVGCEGQPIRSVRVRLREALLHDREVHVVRDEVVRTFPLAENNRR